ncbi:hypothetical protein chiPu_0015431 [Chiloscyllium punctatum]|uniref:Uncharacterized protein n=1 Tax=Chiloscyllium punctatum TaxID=137246 RepID=A0A401T2Q6_CHIPU|nr:hypothetical protein [Chiloscyllium punctatum]
MRGLEKAQWGLETGPTTILILDLVRPGEWARCDLETGPGAVWILSLVWCGDWAWYGLETGPGIVWRLCQRPPGDWAWCCVATGPGELWRLGRYSQLTRSSTVWRLRPVQPGDQAKYGLEGEHGVVRRLWSLQSGDLPWCCLETGPGPVCTQPGATWRQDSVVSGYKAQ